MGPGRRAGRGCLRARLRVPHPDGRQNRGSNTLRNLLQPREGAQPQVQASRPPPQDQGHRVTGTWANAQTRTGEEAQKDPWSPPHLGGAPALGLTTGPSAQSRAHRQGTLFCPSILHRVLRAPGETCPGRVGAGSVGAARVPPSLGALLQGPALRSEASSALAAGRRGRPRPPNRGAPVSMIPGSSGHILLPVCPLPPRRPRPLRPGKRAGAGCEDGGAPPYLYQSSPRP